MQIFRQLILIGMSLAFALSFSAPANAKSARVEKQFRQWLVKDLWPQAKARGISRSVFNEAFNGVTLNWKLPGLQPPGQPKPQKQRQRQAEFRSPGNYFKASNLAQLQRSGRSHLAKYKPVLAQISAHYGVPARIILAIWGRETGYGRVTGKNNAFRVLATKAFMSTRKELFLKETLAALEMVQRGYINAGDMKSSWAGAMGQPQFMPTSFLAHAVDADGDGRRDIWRSTPDTFASIANYLHHFGWQKGRDWGFEVRLPQSVSCALEGPDQGRTFAQWQAMGIKRMNGKPFPKNELRAKGFLMLPAGRLGPAFIVTQNFYVLKDYNESDLYALFIGHLGDKIRWNSGPFKGAFARVDTLQRSDVAKMQHRLVAKGYDVGGADGLAGFKTRRSIGDWQGKNGFAQTCFPNKALARRLR